MTFIIPSLYLTKSLQKFHLNNSVELVMSSMEEEVDEVVDEVDYRYHLNAVKVEDKIKEVFFKVKDYLYSEGNRELFTELTLDDLSIMLYDPPYIKLLKEKDPDFLR